MTIQDKSSQSISHLYSKLISLHKYTLSYIKLCSCLLMTFTLLISFKLVFTMWYILFIYPFPEGSYVFQSLLEEREEMYSFLELSLLEKSYFSLDLVQVFLILCSFLLHPVFLDTIYRVLFCNFRSFSHFFSDLQN